MFQAGVTAFYSNATLRTFEPYTETPAADRGDVELLGDVKTQKHVSVLKNHSGVFSDCRITDVNNDDIFITGYIYPAVSPGWSVALLVVTDRRICGLKLITADTY